MVGDTLTLLLHKSKSLEDIMAPQYQETVKYKLLELKVQL